MEYFNIDENIIPTILKKVAETAAGNYHEEDISFLIEKGIIYVNGDFQIPADYVVMAGGSRDKNNKHEIIDIPLIREVKKLSLPVIGVETTNAANSYVEFYKKEKLSTIDNVDSIIGQTSLVLVINGKEGHYGLKESANSLMPFSSEEENNR